jgi:pyridoxamine 5'-phosphate oxidase
VTSPAAPAAYLPDVPPADPGELLAAWLPADDDPARPTMTLATRDGDLVDARTLLLTGFDGVDLLFHTDARSRKAEQLAADAAVALVLHLGADAHQIVVQGRAEPAGAAADATAFRHRSRYLQQLAWQNTPEFATLPLDDRRASWAAFAADHRDGFGQAPSWTGYRVRPSRITFWQGDAATASRRVEYARDGDDWTVTVRAG